MTALDRGDRAAALVARWAVRPVLSLPIPWAVLRRGAAFAAARRGPRSECAEAWTEVAGVPCLAVTPPAPQGTLVWLHGGGFVLGSPASYRGLAHRLAHRARARVLLPRYRLAPEHPFPAALEDAVDVAAEVSGRGHYWLGGDSAGGNLALGACAEMLARGRRPRGMVLVSPAPDLDIARDAPPRHDEMLLPAALLRRIVVDYLGGTDARDPRASPIRAAFPAPPPTLIQCAAGELLERDIDALAAHLVAQGGDVRVEKASGVPHDYQVLAGLLPSATRAVDRLAAFLRDTR